MESADEQSSARASTSAKIIREFMSVNIRSRRNQYDQCFDPLRFRRFWWIAYHTPTSLNLLSKPKNHFTMLGAVGIGVTDMATSLKFFIDTLNIGLKSVQTFDVDMYYEEVLAFPPGTKNAGSAIILMQYKDPSLPKPINQQGKMVFYVDDVKAVLKRCEDAGCEIFHDLGASQEWPDMCMVYSPDRYIVELMPKSWASKAKKMGDKPKEKANL